VQAVDEFIYELSYKENNLKKRHKIAVLTLNEGEWMRVHLFCNILQVSPLFNTFNLGTNNMAHTSLQHADDAQQSFSSASMLTLHNALPTLEKLHAAWDKAYGKPRYSHLCKLSAWEWPSSTPIINIWLNPMCTSWQWVRFLVVTCHLH
jgi:hypothetical protein